MKKYGLIISVAAAVLFLLSWITPVCDLYADTVYALISDGLGFLTGNLPVNVGECLMFLAFPVAAAAVLLPVSLIFLHKKTGYKKFVFFYLRALLCALLTLLLIYELNWWLPLRSRLMGGKIMPAESFTVDEIEEVRNHIVKSINDVALQCPRDENGHLIYMDGETMRREISEAMHRNAGVFGRLGGYYPRIKEAYCSDVLDWMDIGGYTYPYTMELTCNRYITKLYYPALFTHESAHHQGYYRENEANFAELLVAEQSDEPRLRYAAYLDMYRYVNLAYMMALDQSDPETAMVRYKEQIRISEQVWRDEVEAMEEAEGRYEEDPHPLESVSETATEISETGWETQGQLLGADGYDGVVLLILSYYRENGIAGEEP